MNYLIHLRPKTFLPSFVFVLTGYSLNPHKGSATSVLIELVSLFILYSVLLFGGTCALNTHFDKDEGPLNFLESPPVKPKYLGHLGLAMMILACAWAYVFGFWPFVMSLLATILSVAYSAKIPFLKWRGKEVGGIDVIIDALGCGIVGVILGATIGGAEPTQRIWLISVAFTVSVAGSYPATQIFQLKPSDNYQTARNFSSLLGPAKALKAGCFLLLIGLSLISYSLKLLHDLSAVEITFYGLFFILFLHGVYQCYLWSQSPFENSTPRFKSVIFTLLGARLLWIVAEWIHS